MLSQAHLFFRADTATAQRVDILATLVHEAADQTVVAEDDAGHFVDVLVALVVADVAAVIHQTGHQEAFPQLLGCTFFNLSHQERKKKSLQVFHTVQENTTSAQFNIFCIN